ncbi:MAG: OstA-like protein [Dysgonomonas sp.]
MQRHRIPFMGILCLIVLYVSAQTALSPQISYVIGEVNQEPKKTRNDTVRKSPKKVIEIVHADDLDWKKLEDLHILRHNVIFFHEGAYLYCDSAYYYKPLNTFEAFSNVRMEQGDTLFLYGKYMHYDGNTKLVKVRENVSLEHSPLDRKNPVTLFTDSLNYDRMMNIGYYFDGGMLVDSLNKLTSFGGQYEPTMKMATFKDSVILTNPNFTLYSDRLKYDTDKRIALFTTDTKIVSDSGTIYTTNGWYNTATEESLLLDQSTILNKKGDRLLRGDSILYFKEKGYGEVFGNMFLQDTTKHVILMGNYGYYDDINDYAMATDSAICIEYSQKDSLYIHADTLKLITIIDSTNLKKQKLTEGAIVPILPHLDIIQSDSLNRGQISDSTGLDISIKQDSIHLSEIDVVDPLPIHQPELDSVGNHILPIQDTVPKSYRQIKAYYGVRFYRNDMQGVCDSLQFSSGDSIIHMYKDPILWNTNRQLSGDTIDIFMNDSTIDYMHVKRYAFSIENKDSIHFNQLKSRSLKVYFDGNKKVRQVLAEGNVETISYPEERGGELSGILNWLESSYLRISMLDGKFQRLVVWPKPVGKTTPFHLVNEDQLRLKEFFWYDYLRPLDKDDVFRKVTKKAGDTRPKRSSIFDRED